MMQTIEKRSRRDREEASRVARLPDLPALLAQEMALGERGPAPVWAAEGSSVGAFDSSRDVEALYDADREAFADHLATSQRPTKGALSASATRSRRRIPISIRRSGSLLGRTERSPVRAASPSAKVPAEPQGTSRRSACAASGENGGSDSPCSITP